MSFRTATLNKIGLLFTGQATYSASRVLVVLYLSKRLSAAQMDECAVYISSVLAVSNLCELGMNVSFLKFAAGREGDRWMGVVSRFLGMRAVLTAAVLAVALPAAEPICELALANRGYALALRLGCIAAAAATLSSFLLALLQSRSQFDRLNRQNLAMAAAQAAVAAAVFETGAGGLAALFAAEIGSRMVTFVANGRLLRSAFASLWRGLPKPPLGEVCVFTRWIAVSMAIGALYNYIPAMMLSRWAPPSALGAYGVAASLAGGFGLLMTSTSTVLLPQAVAMDTPERRLNYVGRILPPALAGAAVLGAGAWLGAPLIRHFLGPAMRDASDVFRWLALAQLILLPANPVQFLLYGTNQPQLCTAADALITLVFAGLASLLTPLFGASGPAIALLAGQTSVKVALAAGLIISLRRQVAHVAAAPQNL